MKRVMIIGQPGAGKSWLARRMGEITDLPVVHIDHIHWAPGWVERSRAEKSRLCDEVHARPEWIFEGGHSTTFEDRLRRADTVIWIDMPPGLRMWRLIWRSLGSMGRTRPDMAPGCKERPNIVFLHWSWKTRRSMRLKLQWFYGRVPSSKQRHHLRSRAEVAAFLEGLQETVVADHLALARG